MLSELTVMVNWTLVHLKVSGSTERLLIMNLVKLLFILVFKMVSQSYQQVFHMERKLMSLNTLIMLWRHRTWLASQISLMTLRKASTLHQLKNLLPRDSVDNMNGHKIESIKTVNLEKLLNTLIQPNSLCTLKVVIKRRRIYTQINISKPMVIMHQANKEKEITIGMLIQEIMHLAMEKRNFLMVQANQLCLRELKVHSQKLSL